MKNKETVDQNPDKTVNPEENINAVEESAKSKDGQEDVVEPVESGKSVESVEEVDTKAEAVAVSEAEAEESPVAVEVPVDKEASETEKTPEAKKATKEEAKPQTEEEVKVEGDEKAEAEAKPNDEARAEVLAEEPVDVIEEKKVEEKAEEKTEVKATEKTEDTPEDKTEDKTEVKTEDIPEDKTEDKVEGNEDEKADAENEAEVEAEEEEEEESFEELSAEELVVRLEELVKAEEIAIIKTKVALIKVAFLKIIKEEKQLALDAFIAEGGKKEDFKAEESKVVKRFNRAFEVYRKNKIKHNENQEKLKLENLEKKKEILEKLKELISSEETLKKTYDEFRELQTEWKELGMVPSGEVSNLWQSYHFLVEKFFDKVKINKELRDLDMKKNLELKVELCEKTEELLLENSIIKSFKQLQKFHEEWKEIGPVPQDVNDEIWERFKAATDKINERRREHYGQLQEDQEKNLLAKTGLCEQVEELLTTTPDSMKGWQDQTNKMNELFNVWRSIGRAPKKENTEVWDRFKGSMNTFYTNKKEFLGSIKQEQLNNYNLKVDLCVEAEAIKGNTDWKKTTQDLIRLQQDWKKIGPVPRKHSEKIWKRFRAACDEFFSNKASHFSSVHDNEQENLEKKKELIEKVKTHKFTTDKSKNLDLLKDFQREWMQIGYVPMKEKEKVQKSFRKVVDEKLEELKISSAELSSASYATRMEAVKDSPDAGRVYRKEISFLQNKMSKMRDDINLWENNLGFFANSKQADILKKEFEDKIEKAKQEVAAIEAKVKYLRKMSAE